MDASICEEAAPTELSPYIRLKWPPQGSLSVGRGSPRSTRTGGGSELNFLESMVREYLEWKNHVVRTNVRVGRREKGGYAGELDVVAFDPQGQVLYHYELSMDSLSKVRREARFHKKFATGREHAHTVFPWIAPETSLKQVLVLPGRRSLPVLSKVTVRNLDDFMAETVRADVRKAGYMVKAAIPEQFPLLRTIQLLECGYTKRHVLDP